MDACVVVKRLGPEEKQLEARDLPLSDVVLTAPSKVLAEVATAISRKVRVEGLPALMAQRALDAWLGMVTGPGRITMESEAGLLREAMRLSIELDLQLPDCLYLALAKREAAPLVTADERLVRKAKGLKRVEARLL